ncbi:hypothetical protein D3C78_1698680 [compost metagenome]
MLWIQRRITLQIYQEILSIHVGTKKIAFIIKNTNMNTAQHPPINRIGIYLADLTTVPAAHITPSHKQRVPKITWTLVPKIMAALEVHIHPVTMITLLYLKAWGILTAK